MNRMGFDGKKSGTFWQMVSLIFSSDKLSPGFTNLQSESGISILEQHLKDRRFEDAQQEPVDLNDTLDGLTSKVRHKIRAFLSCIVVLKSRYIKQSISG